MYIFISSINYLTLTHTSCALGSSIRFRFGFFSWILFYFFTFFYSLSFLIFFVLFCFVLLRRGEERKDIYLLAVLLH